MANLIIDGYNLIRQIPGLVCQERISLEQGRRALIQKLSLYQKLKHHHITVVFDGRSNLSDFSVPFAEAGIQICFSTQASSADDVIKKMVTHQQAAIVVVSSDREIIHFARSHGCGVIDSRDFYDKLLMAEMLDGTDLLTSRNQADKPLHKRWTTYKKGPSKKLSKKERKNQNQLKKL